MSQQIPRDDFLELTEDTKDANTIGSSLDHLIGTWTQAEADEMIAVLKEFDMFTESRGHD
ncbi:MAG: hypothetical protein F4X34_05635 [Chloroflexi bacterium]|nr:hypothetical protein [Chloroflexota bacterium]